MPDFKLEQEMGLQVAGVDEVGMGSWAGPVFAAAAILYPTHLPKDLLDIINDSKKLSKDKREHIFKELNALSGVGIHFSIAKASVEEIDRMNIKQAAYLAMQRAVENIKTNPDGILVDGLKAPTFSYPTKCVVKGDQKSFSIAAASILAKVTRDDLMAQLGLEYPAFKWDSNAGYGTQKHQEALLTHGPTEHHRRSYAPIAKLLAS
ncbi:MAG: ribonuclease HII [Alphaproteobacteria bacterium]|jgi:ribonuclease HII|nr:ribonuclease HII [Alphaproteobacteria bacterium]MBT5390252.1 ribonuclease HII [Alphaproteobacteria bacterium]MBT5540018.1 ribonuclease HII [Alphaproteobacteria bacterium]MBT5654538.1 ribonuclease HII [Alphaproteobacteria bacterium]